MPRVSLFKCLLPASVYADAMILNPRCKLSIFKEPTWSDIDCEPYVEECRRHYELEYKSTATGHSLATTSKRDTPDDDDDDEFQAMLAQRVAKRPRTDDYDRFISTENDGSIKSGLAWWKMHHHEFPDLARMVRDTLAVPASGCSVERMFSVSGRVANWERSRLHDKTIGDIMMYKSALTLKDAVGELEECDE